MGLRATKLSRAQSLVKILTIWIIRWPSRLASTTATSTARARSAWTSSRTTGALPSLSRRYRVSLAVILASNLSCNLSVHIYRRFGIQDFLLLYLKVLLSICSLLSDCNPADPLVGSIATQYLANRYQLQSTSAHFRSNRHRGLVSTHLSTNRCIVLVVRNSMQQVQSTSTQFNA